MSDELVKHHVYLNPVQMRSYLAYSNHEILIAGRGMGKSEMIIAPRLKRWCEEMPRALIIGEARTYQQHFTRTLPGIFAGLEKLGWVRDRDYWVGKYAPDKLKIDKPLFRPIRPEYMIHFRTGTAVALVSHDMPGSANGLSAAAVFGDEAKFLKQEKHKDEVMPAVRGNAHIFGNSSSYGGLLLTTDMPVSNSAQWLLEYGDQNHDEERIASIIEIQIYVNELILKLHNSGYSESQKHYYRTEISKWNKLLLEMRRGDPDRGINPSFLFHEASSLENIEVLRPSYFQRMMKDLSPLEYRTSILNHRVKQISDGFYPFLSEDKHGYTMFNNGYLELMGHDLSRHQHDSRQDMDVDTNQPLDIALDYGGNFNCMVIGQMHRSEYRFLKGLHVEAPLKLNDLIQNFKNYYRHHKHKHVRFYYDHTAKQNNAINEYRYYQEVTSALVSDVNDQWTVEAHDIGMTSSYVTRYEMWNDILSDQSNGLAFKFNLIHCEDWSTSCMLAPAKQGSKGLEKDKSSERDQKLVGRRERATHYSDAGDTLAYARILPIIKGTETEFSGW